MKVLPGWVEYVAVAAALPAFVCAAVLCLRPFVEPARDGGAAGAAGDNVGATLVAIIERGDTAALREALDRGVLPDTQDRATNVTPLIWAAHWGRLDMMELLVSRGANLEATCDGYGTPLANAAYGGGPAAVRFLLDHGADPDVGTPRGNTPLMMAVVGGQTESVRLLLRAGADVNARDHLGDTALTTAEDADCIDAVALLLAAGARRDPHGDPSPPCGHLR